MAVAYLLGEAYQPEIKRLLMERTGAALGGGSTSATVFSNQQATWDPRDGSLAAGVPTTGTP